MSKTASIARPTVKTNVPLKIVLIYIAIGGLWILFSDRLLTLAVKDISVIEILSIAKGWCYVGITALILYWLIQHNWVILQLSQKKLQESEQLFRDMSNGAPVLLWMSNSTGGLYFFNRRWLNFTERSIEQEQKEGWLESIHPEDVAEVKETYQKAHCSRQYFETEYRLKRAYSGEYRWMLATGTPHFSADGDFAGFIGSCLDINERKQADVLLKNLNEQLEQKVKERTVQLEAINSELEAFSYSVSHDLKAPLRQITTFAKLLSTGGTAPLDSRKKHYLENIISIAQRMDSLINDLLAFSRAGRGEMQYQMVELTPLVAEVRQELEQANTANTINWQIEALPSVRGDPKLLRLVFENLLSNALKYTRTRTAPYIEIGGSRSNKDEVIIHVRDNGVGFDMNYASKLFGVFQRLHPADEFEGNGIGLANVRRIIHRLGGRTWAESEVDKGATFFFSLPQT
jgi:PAS domain S-box-containing protein